MWSVRRNTHGRNSLENVVINDKMHMATALEKKRLDTRHTRNQQQGKMSDRRYRTMRQQMTMAPSGERRAASSV